MHYRVSTLESFEADEQMYQRFRFEKADDFSEEVTELVREYLGPGFVVYVTAKPGSLEMWLTIAVAGGAVYKVYKAIGEYPQFREGLIRLISDMERFVWSSLRDLPFFRAGQITTVGYQFGPSLAAAETYSTFAPVVRGLRNPLVYISIITTALLICVAVLLILLIVLLL
jgi:hypothetical protein